MMGDEHQTILPEFVLLPGVFSKELLEGDRELQLTLKELLRALFERGLISIVSMDTLRAKIDQQRDLLLPTLLSNIKRCLVGRDIEGRIIDRVVTIAKPEASAEWWMKKVIESDTKLPFDCVTCGDDQTYEMGNGDKRFTTLKLLQPQTNSPQWKLLRDDWQKVIKHCKGDYKAALAPMLRFAYKVEIVDPYLDPRLSKTEEFIKLVSHLLHRKLGVQVPSNIKIHTCVKPFGHNYNLNDVKKQWTKLLSILHEDYSHDYTLTLWERMPDGPIFHDRCIFTNQNCGIQSGQSFEIRTENYGDTRWLRLSRKSCNEERVKYLTDGRTYKHLCDPLVFKKEKRKHTH